MYSIPIAVTIMLAKLVGDFFNEGIYDMHVTLRGYPFLPEQPPPDRAVLQASDVMAQGVRTVCELEQVGTLLKLLQTTSHHGFPVAARGGGGGVLGIILRDQVTPRWTPPIPWVTPAGTPPSHPTGSILRDQIYTILRMRRFESRRASSPHLGSYFQHHAGPASQQPPLTADDFLRPWTAVSVDQLALSLSPEDMAMVVDLRPYIIRRPRTLLEPSCLHTSLFPHHILTGISTKQRW